jgi:integrase
MNTLREALQGYLELRRSLGFKMRDAGLLLPRFVSFMETRQAEHISTGLALEWAQHPSVQPAEWARRLCFVRGFARHRSATDSRTEIPPVSLLPHRSTRARPYLYTEAEVQRLLEAALVLPIAWPSTPLRPWVFHCLIGLLSVTGLRISEALNLELGDVDLEEAVLMIRVDSDNYLGRPPSKTQTAPVAHAVEFLICSIPSIRPTRPMTRVHGTPIAPPIYRIGHRQNQKNKVILRKNDARNQSDSSMFYHQNGSET